MCDTVIDKIDIPKKMNNEESILFATLVVEGRNRILAEAKSNIAILRLRRMGHNV